MSCEDASFEIFGRPLVDSSVEFAHDEELLPITALINSSSSVEFSISSQSEEFIDLSELRLHIRASVTTADGAEAPADDKVALVKYWPSSLFRQCDMLLNGTLVTTSSSMYGYLSFMQSLLSYPTAVKNYQQRVLEHSEGWLVKQNSNTSEAYIRLHLPLCNQQKLLPNNVSVRIRLLRAADEFVLMSKDKTDKTKYKISLDHCSLFVRRITPSHETLLKLAKLFSTNNAVFPIVRIFPKFFTLGEKVREHHINNVCQGKLPSRIIVGLVSSSAFSGTLATNPYKFEHFNLDFISILCNGRSYPSVPITADFPKGQCRRAYASLLDTIQGPCTDVESLGISLKDYITDTCLFGFTLAKVLTGASPALPREEEGYVNCKIRFAEDLKENVNVIFWMEHLNSCEIDSARNVYLDYAA